MHDVSGAMLHEGKVAEEDRRDKGRHLAASSHVPNSEPISRTVKEILKLIDLNPSTQPSLHAANVEPHGVRSEEQRGGERGCISHAWDRWHEIAGMSARRPSREAPIGSTSARAP